MKRRLLLGVAVASGLALSPAVASAKGVTQASMSGPGLTSPVRLGAEGAGRLADAAKLYATFSTPVSGPGPLQADPRAGDLGPRYVATYTFAVPEQRQHGQGSIRQDLYPFATTGPVVYTPPGQKLFATTTSGGWHAACPALTLVVIADGVPIPPSYHPLAPPPAVTVDAQPVLAG
jgi:hypothetical protein